MAERYLKIDSANSTWLFDTEVKRFRRVPRGTDLGTPALAHDWEPYFHLEIDLESGGFSVALNADGTKLLRAYRDDATVELPTATVAIAPEQP